MLTLGGCTTRYRRANQLAKEGNYVEAAALFEQLLREDPKDPELPELLQRARYRAVEHALGQARQYRLAEDPSASQRAFAQGLELRRRWNVRLDGALEQTVEDEREDATTRLFALVRPHTEKGEALVAESLLARYAFLLQFDELAALRSELERATAQSGVSSCARLRPTATAQEPYWSSLVARYCKHFRAEPPREPRLPDTFFTTRLEVALEGAPEGLAGKLQQQLETELRRGPYFEEQGPLEATLRSRGTVVLRQRQDPVRLSAEWSEPVPYVEYVRETLTETIPVGGCETYQEQTAQGPLTRVREVTRNETKTKEVVVPKTHFQMVPRVFEYQAVHHERILGFSARVELEVGGQPGASAGMDASDTARGYAHDVQFDPAKVRPVRPNFPPAESWWEANAVALAQRFSVSMREGWRTRFCRGAAYSVNEAARCARVGEDVPPAAQEALQPRLGGDAEEVLRLFVLPHTT